MNRETDTDASLDPWALVPLISGESVLFGYAVRHEATGGLAWTASSEVLFLDDGARLARTRSGRRYALGRVFQPLDVGGEGDEARTAFEHLVGGAFERSDSLLQVDRTCPRKMARHLAVPAPSRRARDILVFTVGHAAEYAVARKRARLQRGEERRRRGSAERQD